MERERYLCAYGNLVFVGLSQVGFGRFLTLSGQPSSEVVVEVEWILDGDAGRVPHLLELGQGSKLPHADHQVLVVETWNKRPFFKTDRTEAGFFKGPTWAKCRLCLKS